MVYSFYKKQRILYLNWKGFRPPTIQKILEKEVLTSTKIGIYKLLERFKNTGCITRRPGSGRPSKVTEEIKQIVEEQMSFSKLSHSVSVYLFKQLFLKATENTKDFTSYAIIINIILHIFYLVCRSWNHLLKTSVVQMVIILYIQLYVVDYISMVIKLF